MAGTKAKISFRTKMSEIAVIGAGAWGTALSIVAARSGNHRVRLWAYEPEVRSSITKRRENELFLPGQPIPEKVAVTGDFAEALANASIVISVMPSNHCRRLFEGMLPYLRPEMLFVSATKGLEEDSLLRMTEVISQVLSGAGFRPRLGALSGPSFAKEVARGDPTAVAIASPDMDLAHTVQQALSDPRFRLYTNNDVVGVELGGELKNVVAIAAGVCDGLGLGHNSVAALITRGLARSRALRRLRRTTGNHGRVGWPGRLGAHLYRRSLAKPYRRGGVRTRKESA
jgi:glycerol-3-phosphate dehydrogenase (NAD(P)+)